MRSKRQIADAKFVMTVRMNVTLAIKLGVMNAGKMLTAAISEVNLDAKIATMVSFGADKMLVETNHWIRILYR